MNEIALAICFGSVVLVNQFSLHIVWWHEFVSAALSFSLCASIVMLRDHIPRLNGRAHDLRAVQSMHTRATPRVGGVAIFAAFGLSLSFAPVSTLSSQGGFVLATALLFFVGLMEDLGFDVSPRKRLLAMACASLIVIWSLGVWIPRADIPGFDVIIGHWAVGIPLTLLVTAGIANGFNLIDGVNGLASVTAISAAVSLGLIANQAGYTAMVDLAMILAAGIFGFLIMNYPFGLIFLGDAGAYTLGFVLSWFGIAVLVNAPASSPWAILLTMFWPVADMLLAIYRRARHKAATTAPDRLHVHQMVMRALEICVLGRKRRDIANPLSTLVLAPFVIAPPIAGVIFWNQATMAFLSVIVLGTLFFASYAVAPVLIRRFRRQPG
ncbi:MAG: glycosyltransferase [Pseudorhodobacter sp.]|nr:glycosyltransferase [Pseudorhodobacter sp.]